MEGARGLDSGSRRSTAWHAHGCSAAQSFVFATGNGVTNNAVQRPAGSADCSVTAAHTAYGRCRRREGGRAWQGGDARGCDRQPTKAGGGHAGVATRSSWTTHGCSGHVGFGRYWFASRCSHRQRCSCGAACGVCSRPLLARVVKKESGRIVDCAANVARTQYHQPNSTQRNTTSLLDSSSANASRKQNRTEGRNEGATPTPSRKLTHRSSDRATRGVQHIPNKPVGCA